MKAKEKAMEHILLSRKVEVFYPFDDISTALSVSISEAVDIALEEQKKELTFSGICEVCKKPDEYSEKCLCKDCFKKWVAKEVYHKLVKELDYDDVEKDLLVVFKEYGVKE